MEKNCLFCHGPISGRSDKRFCDDHCRNSYNNLQNRCDSNYIRNINYLLRRNQRILADANPGGKTTVPINRLKAKGFSFDYFTNIFKTRGGKKFFCCYDQGYRLIDNKRLLLMRTNSWMNQLS